MSLVNGTAFALDLPNPGFVLLQGVFECDGCRRWSLASAEVWRDSVQALGTNMLFDNVQHIHWEPARGRGRDFADVPPHIAAAASEAHECFSVGALRAAVLLARSCIEATAKDKEIASGSLADKIDELCKQELIRKHVRDEAHEVRYLGNDMAHGDFVEAVDSDDAEAVLALLGEVLEEVYQSPAITARLKAKREAKRAKRAEASPGSDTASGRA